MPRVVLRRVVGPAACWQGVLLRRVALCPREEDYLWSWSGWWAGVRVLPGFNGRAAEGSGLGGEAEGWVVGVGGEAGGDGLDFGLGLWPGGWFQGAQGVDGGLQAGAEAGGLGVACVLRRLQACDAEGPNYRQVLVRKHAGSLAYVGVRPPAS